MNIGGLQKLTLLDYPGKAACTVFTVGCNLRCPFCHNASLVTGKVGSNIQDLAAFFEKRRGILDGVCVTGGEPLLQPDLGEFLNFIRSFGFSVKLDTNGTLPDRLKKIINERLVDYIAMDIKSSASRYSQAVGIAMDDTSPVFESISAIMDSGLEYEFRTTVVKELHTPDTMREIGGMIKGARAYFLQQFVDSGELLSAEKLTPCSPGEMNELLDAVKPFVPAASLRGV